LKQSNVVRNISISEHLDTYCYQVILFCLLIMLICSNYWWYGRQCSVVRL